MHTLTCRLLLQLADIHMQEKDENSVLSTLDRCIEYASQVNATYTRSEFIAVMLQVQL